jgi:hypothetical protein
MTEGNPIVAAAQGKVSVLEGSGILQDAQDLGQAIDNGQWAGSLVSLFSYGMGVRDLLADPMAKLVSMGLGWAIEFFDPLNAWLDWLTCDTEQLTVAAETWSGISAEMRTAGSELDGYYKTDTAGWSGPAVDQYRIFCADRVDLYNAAAGAAAATANLINRNKMLLTMVRSLVRDLITDGVGKVISIVLRYPPPATLAAAGEVAAQVQRTGAQVIDLVGKLKQALTNAKQLFRNCFQVFRDVRRIYKEAGDLLDTFRRSSGVLSPRAVQAYNDMINDHLGDVAKAMGDSAKSAVKTVGVEAVSGMVGRVGLESVKERTKYAGGMVDETAPEHPAIDNDKGEGR